MKTLKNIALVAAVFIVVSQFLPSSSETSVSRWTSGSKEEIYQLVANFREWHKWSPMMGNPSEYVYHGAKEGVGAAQSEGFETSGGYWNIIKADPEIGIKYFGVFTEKDRIKSTLSGEIILETSGDMTKVTWTERTNLNNLFSRWLHLIPLLQNDLMWTGLDVLKALVERDLP